MNGWSKKDIVEKLRAPDPASLFAEADSVRLAAHGRFVHLRALLETANICRADCLYCGLRHSNRLVERYALDAGTIIEIASRAVRAGFRTVVLQSGEDPGTRPEITSNVVKSILRRTEAAVTLSFGEWPAAVYAMWRQAGADRYLLKFETSDRDLYSRLRPGRKLDDRLDCLGALKQTGYQTGTGFMVGLPGQSIDNIADDLLLLHDLEPDMAGIGPYIPHPETPLGQPCGKGLIPAWKEDPALRDCNAGEMTLRCLAVARIMNPHMHLPATTALGVGLENGYARGLAAGANVIMAGITPRSCVRHYDIYPGRHPEDAADPSLLWRRYKALLSREGYAPSPGRGDGLKQCRALAC
jgi:biotin synthase